MNVITNPVRHRLMCTNVCSVCPDPFSPRQVSGRGRVDVERASSWKAGRRQADADRIGKEDQ